MADEALEKRRQGNLRHFSTFSILELPLRRPIADISSTLFTTTTHHQNEHSLDCVLLRELLYPGSRTVLTSKGLPPGRPRRSVCTAVALGQSKYLDHGMPLAPSPEMI